MKIMCRPRMAGKTYLMLEAMRRNPASVMVCISRIEADRLSRDNPDIEAWRFVTPDEARRGARWDGRWIPRPYELYVDNLDIMLSYLLGRRVSLASMTDAVEVDRPDDPGRIGSESAIAGGWPLPRNPDE